jgi:anti-anti-sigma factor
MDCGGLGALITVRKLAHSRDGRVRLVGATPMVQRLFDVMRAGDLFELVQVKPPAEVSCVSAAG